MRLFIKEFMETLRAIKKDKEEYMKKDPSIEKPYQLIFHAGFNALKFYRYSHFFYKFNLKFLAYLIYYLSRVLYSVDIHPAAIIEPGVVIDHGIGTVIGSTAFVGSKTVIYHGVTLGAKEITTGKRHPTIGRNVLIGAGAKVLGPIIVGDNVKIGANSVVLKNVPANVTVVGIPAKIVEKSKNEVRWIL